MNSQSAKVVALKRRPNRVITVSSPYRDLKKSILSQMLRNRGLKVSGTKNVLLARLNADDAAHAQPFRFLDLPAEIRNIIYHFVKDSEVIPKQHFITWNQVNSMNIRPPTLFKTCRQIWHESWPVHFQHRRFEVGVDAMPEALSLLLWLRHIGEAGRKKLRQLTVRLPTNFVTSIVLINLVNRELSDDATVEYVGRAGNLAMVAQRFRNMNSNPAINFNLNPALDFSQAASLKFLPGLSWFGRCD